MARDGPPILPYAAIVGVWHRLFQEQQFDELAGWFVLPAPVHFDEDIVLFKSHAALSKSFSDYSNLLVREGVVCDVMRYRMAEATPRGRLRIWADWEFDRGSDLQAQRNRMIFYCRLDDGKPRIEMLQFTQLAHDEVRSWIPPEKWMA